MHYWSKCQYTFWTVAPRATAILEISPNIFVDSSKINQYFLGPNQKHLLGLLSNYLVGEKVDKHIFNWKEYVFKGQRAEELHFDWQNNEPVDRVQK